MNVVGGVYDETVIVPENYDLMGSGMRAAAALAAGTTKPTLHAPLDDGVEEEARLLADALGVAMSSTPKRDERVGFRYTTPISTPVINGPSSRLQDRLDVAVPGTALVFGLVEDPTFAMTSVKADTIVFDPQRPRDADPLSRSTLITDRLVVVANRDEMAKLGNHPVGRVAAARLLDDDPTIHGTITKRGASGCLVSYREGGEVRHELIGAHPTTRVWPIGSGDTFSAGVAQALASGADVVQAARVGSAAAAHWCSTRSPAIPSAILNGDFSSLPRPIPPAHGRVYLAGPFFSVGERWLVEAVRDQLYSLGVEPWSPVHEVGPGGFEVAQQDIEGLQRCDAVLALLDHADPGTVFEVGWAVRDNMPVVGYATTFNPEGAKMMAGTSVELHRDISTACYRAAWAAMGLQPRAGWIE